MQVRQNEALTPVTSRGHSLIELLKGIVLSASLALLAARMLVSCIKIN